MEMPTVANYPIAEQEKQKEPEIIAAAKADPKNFAPLYEKHYEQIFRFIIQRINDRDTALDITSQVFLKAMCNLNRYEYKGVPFSSWLYRIAYNEIISFIKENEEKRSVNVNSADVLNMADEIETGNKEQLYEKLLDMIGDLPEEELQLVEMRFFEKRSFKEIGEILEITENNAKVKVYRTLEKLKKKLVAKL